MLSSNRLCKVRGTITCTDCQKPRCVYSAKLLTIAQSNAIQCIREAEMYSCGASLFGEAHPLCEVVVVRTTLMCELPVEATCYGATTTNLPDVCNHCGGASGAPFVNDDSFKQLEEQYTRVRSYCLMCKPLGKESTTWGAMTATARKKQKLN